jgi:hypothetical protein
MRRMVEGAFRGRCAPSVTTLRVAPPPPLRGFAACRGGVYVLVLFLTFGRSVASWGDERGRRRV